MKRSYTVYRVNPCLYMTIDSGTSWTFKGLFECNHLKSWNVMYVIAQSLGVYCYIHSQLEPAMLPVYATHANGIAFHNLKSSKTLSIHLLSF